MTRYSFILFILVFFSVDAFSQCCGGCNPIGGNTNLGTIPKNILQINAYHRNAFSEGYMEKDHISDFRFVKNATSNYEGLQIGYGVTKRLTVDFETGYYLNRTQNFELYNYKYSLNGYGGSSLIFSGRYNIVKDTVHDFEFTAGAGVKLPWSKTPMISNGVELSEDVQPSNGAYGIVLRSFLLKEFDKADFKVFLINTVTLNGVNPKSYKEGNSYITALFISKTFFSKLTAIAQVRNEVRDRSYRNDAIVTSSGGYRFVFIPQLNYTFKKKYNISALYELPMYQYYNGIQLRDVSAFSINLNIRIGTTKQANELCKKP